MANVTVKKSKIQGKGVFANKDFRKDQTIMEWDTSNVLIEDDAIKTPLKDRKYLVCSSGLYILSKSPEKYLNHNCNPNTMEMNHSDIAKRNIRKGEELTTDYSLTNLPHLKMKCNCKSNNCKKII